MRVRKSVPGREKRLGQGSRIRRKGEEASMAGVWGVKRKKNEVSLEKTQKSC